ncbi:VirB6/TrbL-like conjugal transfer protein, CD1112 family [Clostridium formicaceticum]|uniref:Conjugal transfer protein TrbL n=1 Tax=Clostridium formicaceticum TaxID=1497 RepID=A0AAC9WHM9_9CLOT|nr:CD0415/CD1112 family protein [Clostridium formicaceticum]AOY74744.1 hypothetical protein BJL90_01505 [Clostridium formicaceticum]ARE89131.1 hypothetical protein CLFO_35370 [Clostridium formicaceticum]
MNSLFENINEKIFLPAITWCLETFMEAFIASLNVLQTEVGKTPIEFSATLVSSLRAISTSVIMPVAGLILTYIFCYELINMLLEKNNMAEFEMFNLYKAIFKIFLAILLVTNCFDITLAFFDVGQSLVAGVTSTTITVSMADITEQMITQAEANIGMGLIYLLLSAIIMIVGWVAVGLIYLVAWGRMITILIYISVAPIPFATLMNRDWIGHIGQNYLKNLCALAIQGFLMMICMLIYGGLVSSIEPIILSSGAMVGIVLILVSMFVCVKSLMSCLNLAKSIFGVS